MKAAGKEQDIIVVDRNVDKVVAYKVARKDQLKQQGPENTHTLWF